MRTALTQLDATELSQLTKQLLPGHEACLPDSQIAVYYIDKKLQRRVRNDGVLTYATRLENVGGVSEDEVVQVSLSAADIWRLSEGLDAHEYWELGGVLPRNNGEVFIPGDLAPGADRYWDGVEPTPEQQEAIDEVRRCRALRERLVKTTGAVAGHDSDAP